MTNNFPSLDGKVSFRLEFLRGIPGWTARTFIYNSNEFAVGKGSSPGASARNLIKIIKTQYLAAPTDEEREFYGLPKA